ncbi:hypothetical protein E8E12_001859 [Didymella heteroderae]|uniref:Uncharacterized protein n=1 Tax=Didymella heteroderae TaxID=1769908 RepID=A0A9P4WI89_9PLEO|nr:hypothetical protein E8E12_001859 [Didymella heteroderae]
MIDPLTTHHRHKQLDDDTLVELSTADYQKRATPAVLPPPFRPAVPSGTLQLFGESSQKQMPKSPSTPIKQEKQESAQPTQGQTQPHLPQLFQTVISKPSTGTPSASLHSTGRNHDTATFNALTSGGAATVIRPHGPTQPLPVPTGFMTPSSQALPRNSSASSNVLHQQVQHANNLIVNRAYLPADKGPSTLRRSKEAARDIPEDGKVRTSESGLSDGLTRRTSDGDIDIEDIPLAKIDVKAELKRLGATISRNDSMNADSPALEIAKCSTFKIDVQKTHLPSPSPSLASAPSTPTISETACLLNRFRKPTAPLQRQTSVLSQSSKTSTTSRKRKIDMSDDEQSDHAPPPPSCTTTTRKKPTISLGSPLKKPLSPKGSPPPSASPISPAGKRMNGFGFRTKSTITSYSTPATPPRLSMKQIKPATPVTPPQSTPSARGPLSTPPSRRKAALRAQSNVQKIMEADEPFHAEDDIFCSDTRKPSRRDAKGTSELGRRLRSMSITPVPIGTRISSDKVADESVYSRERFLQDRAKGGDRLANRAKNIDKIIGEDSDEDYEDLETSEFFYVGDLILMKGQENRLTGV